MQLREIFILTWLGMVTAFPQIPSTLLTVTRHNNGDIISITKNEQECDENFCIGLSSGTAKLIGGASLEICSCQCHDYLPTFREDLRICVDDIQESILAPFVGGSTSQQIPFVFLPLEGQIIHPSKEISFAGLRTPVCAVSKAKFLTEAGWVELRSPTNGDVPFRILRDEGRTFLQWAGEPDLRIRLTGRLVLVFLRCKEAPTEIPTYEGGPTLYTPSVAFRVAGSPVNNPYNVTEVTFFPDAHAAPGDSDRLSVSEYIAIGICSVLLGLIYVASVFLYLHLRKRNRPLSDKMNSTESLHDPHSLAEEGVIKNNPLLGMSAHFQQPDSDTTNSDNDGTLDVNQQDDRKKHLTITSVMVHPQKFSYSNLISNMSEYCHQDSSSIERLPEENVSIIETIEGRDDSMDSFKAITGIVRRKLYFNPAYFEPHLLLAPPPAALEFLTKIREVIAIAKQKMESKKFTPSLLVIPEEDGRYTVSAFDYGDLSSRRNSIISLKRENSRRKSCTGCPGCEPQDYNTHCGKLPEFPTLSACRNCFVPPPVDSKQRSIRKWLEDVPEPTSQEDNKHVVNLEKSASNNSIRSLKKLRSPTMMEHSPEPSKGTRPSAANIRSNMENYKEGMRSSRRLRSPTGSLPSEYGELPNRGPPSLPPRANSDRAQSPDSDFSSCGSDKRPRKRRPGRIVRKPKLPPPAPPINAKQISTKVINNKKPENIYDTVAIDRESLNLPPPDMIHEAMIVDEEIRIPTLTKKQMKAVIDEFCVQRALNKRLPNGTIDYEADSLERSANKGYSTPVEYTEVSSSQPSPSLSTALPLEEELTMRNAIFNKKTGNRTISKINMDALQDSEDNDYEIIVLKSSGNGLFKLPELLQRNKGYSLVSEVYVNNGYNYNSAPSTPSESNSSTLDKRSLNVRYALDNQPGKLLIEVKDCPDNYIPVEDSDSFEADTLDRKQGKSSFIVNEFTDSLERPQHILLRTTGSFRKENGTHQTLNNLNRNFGSLREIYEAKTRQAVSGVDGNVFTVVCPSEDEKEGKLLTLEERHSKRQRSTGVRPDVVPPPPHNDSPIYERPKPPRKVLLEGDNISDKPPLPPKNGKNRSANSKNTLDKNKLSPVGIPERTPGYELKLIPPRSPTVNNNRVSNILNSNDLVFRKSESDQFILQTSGKHPNNASLKTLQSFINSELKKDWIENQLNQEKNVNLEKIINTEELLVNSKKSTNVKRVWRKVVDYNCHGKTEDSGYLSTDSSESRPISSRLGSHADKSSETDESIGDGHSESGGESVETHSVLFGRFRRAEYPNTSLDSGVDADSKSAEHSYEVVDETHSSDSEHASYATVVPLESCVSTMSSTRTDNFDSCR